MANDVTWSKTEKAVARKAFDAAYQRECAAILARLKEMAAAALEPRDIWHIHDILTERRRDTDRKYDYRYSVLTRVLGQLLAEGWLEMSDIADLRKDKIEPIKRMADFCNGL
jgi:hypothetical protein